MTILTPPYSLKLILGETIFIIQADIFHGHRDILIFSHTYLRVEIFEDLKNVH